MWGNSFPTASDRVFDTCVVFPLLSLVGPPTQFMAPRGPTLVQLTQFSHGVCRSPA